jgi:hypothetical protein
MSMCVCKNCDAYIDSDFDPDCFIDIDEHETIILCENCRDDRDDELHFKFNQQEGN